MGSNTRNVKLGVCQVFYNGYDLGYTKGGVEVSVTTETHDVSVDQFGKTAINSLIMGRDLKVKVPMAETTLENMVAIMPGAVLKSTGGAVARGTVTFATAASAPNDTVTINGVAFTCKAAPATQYEFAPGADFTASATNLYNALVACQDPAVQACVYSLAGAVITVKFGNSVIGGADGVKGTEGNSVTLAKSGTNVTVSGAKLTGGTEPTAKYVEVQSGTSIDLLTIANELRLHPITKAAGDLTDDFIVPLAGTAGALNYSYKMDDERVYNVEFSGYPDPVTKRMFLVGGRG